MDQKNTIVKCFANPNCLFNHNGVCDNYVINIGADGSCQEYVETITEEEILYENAKKMLNKAGVTLIEPKGEAKRGQRAKCDFYTDGWVDLEIVKEVCQPFTMSKHLCDTKCKYWQLDSYSEWVCGCMAEDFNPRGYCPYYDDGGEE